MLSNNDCADLYSVLMLTIGINREYFEGFSTSKYHFHGDTEEHWMK